jgi:hypothetical protein
LACPSLIDFYKERTDAKLNRITDLLEALALRLSSLDQKVAFIGTDIAHIGGRLDAFEKRLQRIESLIGWAKRPYSENQK